ncbi:tetratricopeptide repeat protein [Chloroflexi bacterium TSY]|nr:tetratricopeptide repeat protein [Chloroflexi bacterium TSY]
MGNDAGTQGDNVAGDRVGRDQFRVESIRAEAVILGDGGTINVNQPVKREPLAVNVPSMPNHFVGREGLLALSAEGLPGVGKTTLAVALAYHPALLAHFADGVLWGGLGKQPDVMRILAVWAQELGRDVSGLENEAERAEVVKNAIGQRALLLVIDDAWGLEEANLLRCGGPNCCHILTTRDQAIARAFAGAAQVESVPVLDDETAYQLLEELAPEACAADPGAARRLAIAAGGLPLTIELLGGYLAAPERSLFPDLSMAALAEMSDPQQRLTLATQRLGTHQNQRTTLQETIALSVDALPDAAQEAFYALGAFAPKPDSFDRAAAEQVTEVNTSTLALLTARNLVEINQKQRLALHQTLAEVAQTETDPAAIERHRTYYLELVNENREDWQRIEPVYGQIKWAWEAALDDEERFEFIWALYIFQSRRGFQNDAQEWIEQGVELAETQGWQHELGRLLNNLGLVYKNKGEWEKAIDYHERSLAIDEQMGDTHGMGQTLGNLGIVYDLQGKWEKAIDYHERSLAISEQVGDSYGMGISL